MSKFTTKFEKFAKSWKKRATAEVRKATTEVRKTAKAATKAFKDAKADAAKQRAAFRRRAESYISDLKAAAAGQTRKTTGKRSSRKNSGRTTAAARA